MDFDQLPPETQIALFTDAANEALAKWQISRARLDLLSIRNAVFAASYPEHPDDFRMVLRVNWPGRKTPKTIRCEGLWLDILAKYGLPVPRIVRAATEIHVTRSPLAFVCSLYSYQTGESLPPRDYTEVHVAQIGRFAASLHRADPKIPRESSFARPRLDAEGIFGADSPYASGAEGEALLEPHRAVLDAVRAKVEAVFGALDAAGGEYGLIHGDLKPDNLLFEDDAIRVLDFDDCAWGYFLYDLAPMLLFIKLGLRADGLESRYEGLKRAFWESYTAVRPVPEEYYGALETLAAGRFAASCLWVAAHRDHPAYRGKVESILAGRAAQLAAFLDTGIL